MAEPSYFSANVHAPTGDDVGNVVGVGLVESEERAQAGGVVGIHHAGKPADSHHCVIATGLDVNGRIIQSSGSHISTYG